MEMPNTHDCITEAPVIDLEVGTQNTIEVKAGITCRITAKIKARPAPDVSNDASIAIHNQDTRGIPLVTHISALEGLRKNILRLDLSLS